MKYSKLVRDKIPEIIKAKGQVPIIHYASEEEYWKRLREKLTEEVDEFLKDENTEELADILEVIDSICDFKKFDKKSLYELKEKKKFKRGGFSKKIILEEIKDE
ncbi:MAG: nucleoside triphosphate pyrophosphohydrolase [Candidatus Nanoarchaeia archaeon]